MDIVETLGLKGCKFWFLCCVDPRLDNIRQKWQCLCNAGALAEDAIRTINLLLGHNDKIAILVTSHDSDCLWSKSQVSKAGNVDEFSEKNGFRQAQKLMGDNSLRAAIANGKLTVILAKIEILDSKASAIKILAKDTNLMLTRRRLPLLETSDTVINLAEQST